jgi:hypothetical protein
MQLDNTRIAIRERNLLDTLDLALHVIRQYPRELLLTFLVAAVPLAILNDYLLGWILDVEYREAFFYLEESGAMWRFWWSMTLLVFIEAPLASIFMTAFLGQAVFVDRPSYRQVFGDVRKMSGRLVWCQLLIRGILPFWWLVYLIDRYDDFQPGLEILGMGGLALYAALLRAIRPFINEIVLLERNPLTTRDPTAITIGRRSSQLHGPSGGDLSAKWMSAAVMGTLLTAAVAVTFVFLSGTLFNDWTPGPAMIRYMYPASMWIVVGYLSVVRFLSYLDLRIRHEGWEVELRLRAEASRQLAKIV